MICTVFLLFAFTREDYCCLQEPVSLLFHCLTWASSTTKFQKYYCWTLQQWNCRLALYVLFLFEDFNLATNWSLAIDVCICLNHQRLKLLPANLFPQAQIDEIVKFKSISYLMCMHRHGTRSDDVSDLSISRQNLDFWQNEIFETLHPKRPWKDYPWKCLNSLNLIYSG